MTAHGMNTRCTPERAMGVLVDSGVLDELNSWKTVDRSTVDVPRGCRVAAHAFVPPQIVPKTNKPMHRLNMKGVTGYGPANWYSPAASTMMQPYADLIARRLAAASKISFKMLEYTWLSRLCSKFVLLNPTACPDQWFLCIGNICSTIVKGWPMVRDGHIWKPQFTNTTKAVSLLVVDPAKYNAMPIVPVSPMHRAMLQSTPEGASEGSVHILPPSVAFGKLTIGSIASDVSRPLLQTAARGGFGDLPVSFLILLLTYLMVACKFPTLFNVLVALIQAIIPVEELTDDLMDHILQLREVSLEPSSDLEEVCTYEWVLDIFEAEDRVVLEKEIKSAKDSRSEWDAFKTDFRSWQA